MKKAIFIDVDGVLNDHEKLCNNYCGIKPECMNLLNWIVEQTRAIVVVSSSWRYMITEGAMTLMGFDYMFKTHGFKYTLSGHTVSDEVIGVRGEQISDFIERYNKEWYFAPIEKYVVIDDLDEEVGIEISANGHTIVQTNSKHGLTKEDAIKVVEILNENSDSPNISS